MMTEDIWIDRGPNSPYFYSTKGKHGIRYKCKYCGRVGIKGKAHYDDCNLAIVKDLKWEANPKA